MANARQTRAGWFLEAITLGLVIAHSAASSGAFAAAGKVATPPPTVRPTPPAALAANVDIDATLAAAARYRHGDERRPLHAVQQLVLQANSLTGEAGSAFRARLADRMAVLLTAKDATAAAKAFVCGQMADIATEKQAPALAALLADKETADAALRALARIPGPAVDRVLRDAVGTLPGSLKIGAVSALGERRDRAATDLLIAMLAGADEGLACAAASALGKIGGESAGEVLQKALASAKGRLRAELAEACLTCAERLLADGKGRSAVALYERLSGRGEADQVRMAALRGVVLASPQKGAGAVCAALTSGDPALESIALQLVPEVSGAAATEQFAQCLAKVPLPVQTLLLSVLAVRGDAAARGAVEVAASSADRAVRLAAVNALGTLGNEATLKTLLDRTRTAVGTAEGEAARNSLVRLRAPGVNEVLTGMLAQAGTGEKAELIRMLAARNAVGAVPGLAQAAENPDGTVRRESWKALGSLAKPQAAATLLDLLVRVREDEREEAEKAVAAVLRRTDRPDVTAVVQRLAAGGSPAVRTALIRIASTIGDDRTLPALRQAVQSGEPVVREAAVRGLTAWPTPAPLEDLVNLARNSQEPVHRVLALRAAIRLSSKAEGRTPAQMTGLVTELMQLATQASERKAVLTELGRCPTLDALHLAQKFLADADLATEAGLAVTQIAFALRDTQRDAALAALLPLLAGPRDPVVVGRAGKVLKDILKPVNLALGATATSPDGLDLDGASGGDQAAIDGEPNTYWDEADNADQYRLKVTFRGPTEVSSINILWHPYEQHQAKNLDVLCDGKVVAEVRKAKCFEHEMFVAFATVRCTSVELVIPGKNGLVSPAIHEFQIFGHFPPETPGTAGAKDSRRTEAPAPVHQGGLKSTLRTAKDSRRTETPAPQPPKYSWKQTDATLTLLNHDRVVWQWNYAANLAKPYFHPVALTDGTVLTAPSPADHPWHRALWFSWKMLNGVNYWEENPATGKAQGLSELRAAQVAPHADGSARIELEVSYHPAHAPPVLTERRRIEVSVPDVRGVYRIDWCGEFTACVKDVVLEGGTAGGGYAGLSVRISQTSNAWTIIDSTGRRDVPATGQPGTLSELAATTHGQRARWADFSLVDTATQQPGGIAILDHPSNPRHPPQWHNILAANGRFGYFSPAMLWSERFTLPASQRFALRYRIIVHPGRVDQETIEKEWQAFAS